MRKIIGEALIFVKPTGRELSTEEFAQQVFTRLGIIKKVEWTAPHSIGDEVGFGSDAMGIEVSVCYNDKSQRSRYPFLICLKPKVAFGDTGYLIEHARNLAKHWSHSGWNCFVPREGLYEITNYEDGYVYAALPAASPF